MNLCFKIIHNILAYSYWAREFKNVLTDARHMAGCVHSSIGALCMVSYVHYSDYFYFEISCYNTVPNLTLKLSLCGILAVCMASHVYSHFQMFTLKSIVQIF